MKSLIGYVLGVASCVAPVHFFSEVTVSIDWSALADIGAALPW